MNKNILVTIGLIIGTLGFIISVAGIFNVRDPVSNAIVIQTIILYSLCLIIVGTRRET